MQNKLFKKNIRVVIPFKNEEDDDFIEIKNANEYVIQKIKTKIIDRINGNDDFDNNDILEYLIKELTNVKLNMSLKELLNQDISYECKIMLYHITEIFNEIQEEILCLVKLELMSKKVSKLEEDVIVEMQQV